MSNPEYSLNSNDCNIILMLKEIIVEGIMSVCPRYCIISRFLSASEATTEDYDISSLLETVDFSDGSSQSVEYCSPIQGQIAF